MKEEMKNLSKIYQNLISLSNILVCLKKMLSYCLKCRKNTESKNTKVVKTKNGRIMLLSKCGKEQEASGLLSSLGIITTLSKIPLVDPLLF